MDSFSIPCWLVFLVGEGFCKFAFSTRSHNSSRAALWSVVSHYVNVDLSVCTLQFAHCKQFLGCTLKWKNMSHFHYCMVCFFFLCSRVCIRKSILHVFSPGKKYSIRNSGSPPAIMNRGFHRHHHRQHAHHHHTRTQQNNEEESYKSGY